MYSNYSGSLQITSKYLLLNCHQILANPLELGDSTFCIGTEQKVP